MDELIDEDRSSDARRVWPEAMTAAGLPYSNPPNRSLVWNGDFRIDFANGGLDWRWWPVSGVLIDFDSEPGPNGSRAVRLDFSGGANPELPVPFEFVPVEPGRSYHFHAYMRTEQITTESGIHFQVADPHHSEALNLITDNFIGSHPWTSVDADFTAAQQTHFVVIRVVRYPSRLFDNKLGGTAWIADVSLVPTERNSGSASFMSALRAGLSALIAFAVLAFGAADVWAASALEIGSAILLAYWAFIEYRNPQAKVQWPSLTCPLAAFLAIGLLQLVFHGTANAFLTRSELLRAASAFLTFFLVAQAFRTRTDLSQLAWFIILLSFSVSLFAIVQQFSSNGKIYWFQSLEIPGAFFGPYVNRNHFAGFVELTMPMGLALIAFRGVRRDLIPLVTLLVIVPVGAIVLSGSRAGIISAIFQLALLLVLARRRQADHRGQILGLAAATIAAVVLISWLGTGTAVERFSALRPGGDVSLARRASMARSALHVFFDHPIKGCGLGALVDVYPRYETIYDGRTVDHVHNDYAETLAETGILGGLCGVAFLWLLYRDARRNFEAEQGHLSRALHGGAIVAVSGILLHSFVDFNLHLPANAALFLVQAYVATSPPLPSAAQAVSPRRGT